MFQRTAHSGWPFSDIADERQPGESEDVHASLTCDDARTAGWRKVLRSCKFLSRFWMRTLDWNTIAESVAPGRSDKKKLIDGHRPDCRYKVSVSLKSPIVDANAE